MYTVSANRTFVARHFLTVAAPATETEIHDHRYTVEIGVSGSTLDDRGYLVDIVDLSSTLDAIADRYGGETLNELEEFGEKNPSVERFAGVIADRVGTTLDADQIEQIRVRVREDDVAWASYTREY